MKKIKEIFFEYTEVAGTQNAGATATGKDLRLSILIPLILSLTFFAVSLILNTATGPKIQLFVVLFGLLGRITALLFGMYTMLIIQSYIGVKKIKFKFFNKSHLATIILSLLMGVLIFFSIQRPEIHHLTKATAGLIISVIFYCGGLVAKSMSYYDVNHEIHSETEKEMEDLGI